MSVIFKPLWKLTPEAKADAASLLLRLALACVFVTHGLEKILMNGAGGGTTWLIATFHPPAGTVEITPFLMFVQVVVAWGETLGGVALLLGLFTRPAAVALILLQAGAVYLITIDKAFSEHKNGGYEYNLALMAMCLPVLVLGGCRFSLDRLFRRRAKAAPAAAPPAAAARPEGAAVPAGGRP